MLIGAMTIKINHGVPLPIHGGGYKYPWLDLREIGDSFLVVNGELHTVRSASYRAARKYGWKFYVAVVKGGVRVWRVEKPD